MIQNQPQPFNRLLALIPIAGVGIILFLMVVSLSFAQDNWTTIPDSDPGIEYGDNNWTTSPNEAAVGESLTWTLDAGATMIYNFQGTAIEILYSAGPEGDSFQADVFAPDGTVVASGQGDSSTEEGYVFSRSLLFENLPNNSYTLLVVNNSGAIWIEALRVQALSEADIQATVQAEEAAQIVPLVQSHVSMDGCVSLNYPDGWVPADGLNCLVWLYNSQDLANNATPNELQLASGQVAALVAASPLESLEEISALEGEQNALNLLQARLAIRNQTEFVSQAPQDVPETDLDTAWAVLDSPDGTRQDLIIAVMHNNTMTWLTATALTDELEPHRQTLVAISQTVAYSQPAEINPLFATATAESFSSGQ